MPASRRPIALLPLRLEIRHIKNSVSLAKYTYIEKVYPHGKEYSFRGAETKKENTKPKREIWIRWYPDDCQVFPPVGRITETEIDAYNLYIKRDKKASAWNTFVNSIGLHRARFLLDFLGGESTAEIEAYNLYIESDKKESALNSFVKSIGLHRARFLTDFFGGEFIDAGVEHSTDSDSSQGTNEYLDDGLSQFLSKGAKLKVLPKTINLYTIKDRATTFLVAKPIDPNIVFSGNDIPFARWITDFEKAVEKGMGIKITDPALCSQVENADWLIAVGHNDDSGKILEELLLRHKALGRFNVLPQDTPTNNTEEEKSPFVANESGTEFENEIPDNNPTSADTVYLTNADILEISLGLNEKVFAGLKNAHAFEQEAARAMNKLLWEACTTAYSGDFAKKNPATWKQLAKHFVTHVLGRGAVPAIQIGQNPYGIVLATDLEKWTSVAVDQKPIETIIKYCNSLKEAYLRLSESSPRIDLLIRRIFLIPLFRFYNPTLFHSESMFKFSQTQISIRGMGVEGRIRGFLVVLWFRTKKQTQKACGSKKLLKSSQRLS